MEHFESWRDLVNPEFYIKLGGFWLVLFIIFAETGLFIGFFLPGDSLLFISGIYSSTIIGESIGSFGSDFLDTTVLALLIALAAVLGNIVGYWFGFKGGAVLFEKKDTFLFKKKHLMKAHDFYEEHGATAMIIARFLPIIRTFAPIVAGIVKMNWKKFMIYNVLGALAWSFIMIYSGHYLDKIFRQQFDIDLKKHLELIIVILVVVTTLPILFKMFYGKKKNKSTEKIS